MYRIILFSALCAIFAAPLAAQTTQTGSVTVTIGLIGHFPPPKCTIATLSPSLNFGTVTASRSSTTKTASTSIRVSAPYARSISAWISGSSNLTNGNGAVLSAQSTASSPSCTGEVPAGNGTVFLNGSCTYPIQSTVRIPARATPGTYTGSTTFSVTCS